MREFRTRVGRIRMKNGGADVRVLNREPINPDGENWRGKIIENARAIAAFDEPNSELVGYLMIGIFADGQTSFGFRYDKNRCPIPLSLMPSWVAEIVRRDMIVEPEARDTFNEMFEWQDNT